MESQAHRASVTHVLRADKEWHELPDSIQYYTGVYLEQAYDLLQEQIYNGLCFEVERCCDSKDRASEIAIAFINNVPHIKYLLSTDVKVISEGCS